MASFYIDKQFCHQNVMGYLKLVKPSSEGFKFRCHICGDSKKKETLTRGNLFRSGDSMIFHCYNCSSTMNFFNFIKSLNDEELLKLYRRETFEEDSSFLSRRSPNKRLIHKKCELKFYPGLEEISSSKKSIKYLKSRNITNFKNIFFVRNFREFYLKNFPEKDLGDLYDHERLVFILTDVSGKVIGFQGRKFLPKSGGEKYITSPIGEDVIKQFGMNNINIDENVYAMEGIIDSLFIKNSIASLDGSISKTVKDLKLPKNTTIIHDNEPRNSQIMLEMLKSIELGYNVFFWERHLNDINDINELILRGQRVDELKKLIDKNSSNGLKARLKYEDYNRSGL